MTQYVFIVSLSQAAGSKWGDLGSLVNLGGISMNESKVTKQAQQAAASNYTPSSFAGLDGFSKSQTMVINLTRVLMTCNLLPLSYLINCFYFFD